MNHCRLAALAALALTLAPSSGMAQTPTWKGVWEPVSYTEDLGLSDVFFVTTEIGWASGAAGTIISTRDGGTTWTAQLGGDPGSADRPITKLRFLDEYRGWAVQGAKLLRTQNGEDWEEANGTMPNWMSDYTFVSERRGVASGTTASQGNATEVFLTVDGGTTWKPVAQCAVRVQVDGVNRNLTCIIDRFHFPTPDVGYLVAYVQCVGTCGGPPIVGKTENGGESWRFIVAPGDVKLTRLRDIFFVDERTGFVHAATSPTEPKVLATSDGGETWRGLVASPGRWIRFADPEVGWALDENKLSFTTDGGRRWNSRAQRFPTQPRALSFPRRDRAYVVGDHGMVFRYSLVPSAESVVPSAIDAVAMPEFTTSLDEQVTLFEAEVGDLQAAVEQAPPEQVSDETRAASGAPAMQLSAFVNACCASSVGKLDPLVLALADFLPTFVATHRNTNLLAAGLRMLTELPRRFGDLRSAVQAFKEARDKEAALTALSQITTAAQAFHEVAKAAVQTAIPPISSGR